MADPTSSSHVLHERYEVALPDVVADSFDGEVVIINLDSGVYFSVAGDSGAVWEAVVAGADLDQVSDDRRNDLTSFVGALVEHGLVRVRAGGPAAIELPSWTPGTLAVEAFSDLQDLLNLDPVHDVDSSTGWPATPPSA